MARASVAANRPWEGIVGYSRAVRVGVVNEVSGSAAAYPDGHILSAGDLYRQTAECLRIIGEALGELGASFEDVVRTRVFLRDMSRWEDAGRGHGEVFSAIRPANTFVEVSGFVDPDILVEVEASAVAPRP